MAELAFDTQVMKAAKGEEFQRQNNMWIKPGEIWCSPADKPAYKFGRCSRKQVPFFYNWIDAPNGCPKETYTMFCRYILGEPGRREIVETFPGQWRTGFGDMDNTDVKSNQHIVDELWGSRISTYPVLNGNMRWSYLSNEFVHFHESPYVHFPVMYLNIEKKGSIPRNLSKIVKLVGICHHATGVPPHLIGSYECPRLPPRV